MDSRREQLIQYTAARVKVLFKSSEVLPGDLVVSIPEDRMTYQAAMDICNESGGSFIYSNGVYSFYK